MASFVPKYTLTPIDIETVHMLALTSSRVLQEMTNYSNYPVYFQIWRRGGTMQKLESLGLSRRLESPHECPTGPAMIIAFAHKSTLDPGGGGGWGVT